MSEEMAVLPPDSRDWTDVITHGCSECGYEPHPRSDTGRRLRATLATWKVALADPYAPVRPTASRWSASEYACHVRDVCSVFRNRLALMLRETDPEFGEWDGADAALSADYAHTDTDLAGHQLATEIGAAAQAFDLLTPAQWPRTGRRSDGHAFTVETLARYLLHEAEHHAHDAIANRQSRDV